MAETFSIAHGIITSWMQARRTFNFADVEDNGPAPMEVGAVGSDKGYGKSCKDGGK